ncbi:hypothetical protein [Actinokineospora sp. UTMC 2448]|uniref:hypothetical protein n=1 Tax=Actinokineospora sp. UTMC 2448 TaxID=2268449 RepID=UPI0021648B33|nr:hypothetical protein [Actinokineospora sp. UTMC 2448]UVS82493.1 hypothetical protein Actkin_06266 [Actinokineospora sp. UTMC 2448]
MGTHRWRGYDHAELHSMINSGPGPSASTPQTEYWESLLRELGDIDHDLNAKLGTLAATWQGAAGDGAQGALNPLQVWASDSQTGASGMRASTEYQAEMIARARAEMPEPVAVTTPAPSGWAKLAAGAALFTGDAGPAMAVAQQAADHEAQEAARDAAAQKAVDTMESYAASSEFNRNTLGEFVPPPDVVVSTPAPSGGTGTSAAYFSSATASVSGGSGGSAPSYAAPVPPSGGGGGYTPPSGGGGSATPFAPGGTATPPAAYTQPFGTTPSGYTLPSQLQTGPAPAQPALPPTAPPSAPPPAGPLALPGPPGSGGHRQATPFAPGGTDTENTRGNHAFRHGMGVAGEGHVGARGGVVGAVPTPGPRGGAGMGVAGAPGARGDGDDDREHGLADYLIETVDVFGDERTVSQPVIGDEPR